VVDDEEKILTTICDALKQEEFEPLLAENGEQAIQKLKQEKQIQLVLLDWMMPGMNGLDVCKQIRQFSDVPIIFLTAKGDEYDKLLGLEMGADDYITKPFSMRELITRIRVVLRRYAYQMNSHHDTHEECIQVQNLRIDPNQHKVWFHNVEMECTLTEFKILHTLALHPGRVYSRAQLVEIVLGEEYLGYERSIDTHIHNIRKKIKAILPTSDPIRTVFGVGYTLGDSS
jgi:two-component system OmpR family response regulator